MNDGTVKSRKPAMIAGVVVAMALIVAVLLIFTGGGSFADLVAVTKEAEGAEVWLTYFTAEDCLFEALTEDPSSINGAIDRLTSETELLAAHVEVSLTALESFGTRPGQDSLRIAQQGIVDHYLVWEDHLAATGPVLDGINSEPSSIENGISTWLELSQGAVEPISSTFDEAGDAFMAAAESAEDRDLLESLFVPAEVSCTSIAI